MVSTDVSFLGDGVDLKTFWLERLRNCVDDELQLHHEISRNAKCVAAAANDGNSFLDVQLLVKWKEEHFRSQNGTEKVKRWQIEAGTSNHPFSDREGKVEFYAEPWRQLKKWICPRPWTV